MVATTRKRDGPKADQPAAEDPEAIAAKYGKAGLQARIRAFIPKAQAHAYERNHIVTMVISDIYASGLSRYGAAGIAQRVAWALEAIADYFAQAAAETHPDNTYTSSQIKRW
jgi:hypothetical protein